MSVKVPAKMISLEKMIDFDTFTNLPKNVRELGKLIVAKSFKTCPKSNKSPNLITLTLVYRT